MPNCEGVHDFEDYGCDAFEIAPVYPSGDVTFVVGKGAGIAVVELLTDPNGWITHGSKRLMI
jgi:hypothetical protein